MSSVSIPECSVCVETFDTTNHQPMLLSCAHGLCSSCVDKLALEKLHNNILCPECRRVTTCDQILLNRPLIDLISSIHTATMSHKETMCDLCIYEDCISLPSIHCFQCQHWLCSLHASRHARRHNHIDTHTYAEIQSQSDLKSRVAQQLRPKVQNCDMHASNLLIKHCIECDQLVCWKCIDENHADHNCYCLLFSDIYRKFFNVFIKYTS